MDAIIQVDNLTTRVGAHPLHRGLDMTVNKGEIFAIVGSSGAGKTVLLRHLLMLMQPVAGEIRLFGVPVNNLGRSQARQLWARLGVMFQHGALFTSLPVLENVSLPLREHSKLSKKLAHEVARLKIGLAGLAPDAGLKYPSELSGGMTKRAALARALALDPDILFLDEPTSGLDPVSAAAFDDLILELRELLGLTVVMITHDVDSLWRTTDRVAFLGGGKVLEVGPVAELAQSHQPEIQRYFEGPRMRRAQGVAWKQE